MYKVLIAPSWRQWPISDEPDKWTEGKPFTGKLNVFYLQGSKGSFKHRSISLWHEKTLELFSIIYMLK